MREANPEPRAEHSSWTLSIRRLLARNLPLKNLCRIASPSSWPRGSTCSASSPSPRLSGSSQRHRPGLLRAAVVARTSAGRFVNSIHFWSVQVFFVFMVLHLWGQYFMASWRDGRALTWIVGVAIFAFSNRGGLHRVPLPAEPGLAVDSGQCQGRGEVDRARLVLQRPRLRPDVRHPHHAAAARWSDPRGVHVLLVRLMAWFDPSITR